MYRSLIPQILIFLAVVVSALLLGALLAYPASLLLPDIRFSSLAERLSLVCGLLASLAYVRFTLPFTASALGFGLPASTQPLRTIIRILGIGLLQGSVILLVLSITLGLLGIQVIDVSRGFTPGSVLLVLIKGLFTGLFVSLIEELLFRGALFSALQARTSAIWATLLSSLLFAAVHFISYPEPAGDTGWLTGVQLFPEALVRLTDIAILDYFLTLFFLGVLLCLLRRRDGHILSAIAVHAGIIMMIKLDKYIMVPAADSPFDFMVNSASPRLGWLSAFWLLLLVAVFWWLHIKKRP
ncbi:MAG: CPBP family intramembrane glutamic endopeptidase [Gammaproteobacteria bacterium]